MEERSVAISSTTGGLTLAYNSFGDESAPVFLLVTGWCSDLTLWPRGFCEELASRGFRVIRYDNRDSGLSTRTAVETVDPEHPPYTMSDFAADAIGLLDALGIAAAHVAGMAMGGTIAHFIAIEHPERVLSLTPMQTATGAPGFSVTDPSVFSALAAVPASLDPEERHRRAFAIFAGYLPGASFDETDYDERMAESAARGAAIAQGDIQSLANRLSGNRTEKLRRVEVPALVVHSEFDPLVSLEAAQAHAAVFPGGRLLVLEGIGHGVLPPRHWPKLADAMQELAS